MVTEQKGYAGLPKGDEIDSASEPGQPGQFVDIATPNTCLCCGVLYWWATGPQCVCATNGNYWLQDELRRVTCFYHMQEKVKDGLFGALPGEFAVPGGKPVYKPARNGRVAPIIGGTEIKR